VVRRIFPQISKSQLADRPALSVIGEREVVLIGTPVPPLMLVVVALAPEPLFRCEALPVMVGQKPARACDTSARA